MLLKVSSPGILLDGKLNMLGGNAGFVWVWPGPGAPPELPSYAAPPSGFTVHAEIEVEVPVEHGLLMEASSRVMLSRPCKDAPFQPCTSPVSHAPWLSASVSG